LQISDETALTEHLWYPLPTIHSIFDPECKWISNQSLLLAIFAVNYVMEGYSTSQILLGATLEM